MKKTYNMLIIIAILLSVTACGGGSSAVSDVAQSVTDSLPADSSYVGDLGTPPDPGASADTTVLGVDTNSNNVRDEVDIAIAARYPEDTVKRAALTQAASSIQDALAGVTASDSEASSAAMTAVIKAADCLAATSSDPKGDMAFIEFQMIDTQARAEAYEQFNLSASGQFFAITDDNLADACK